MKEFKFGDIVKFSDEWWLVNGNDPEFKKKHQDTLMIVSGQKGTSVCVAKQGRLYSQRYHFSFLEKTIPQDIKALAGIIKIVKQVRPMMADGIAAEISQALYDAVYRLPVKHTVISDEKLGNAILTRVSPVVKDGKFVDETTQFEVRVMMAAEGWALVRRKGCMPFACSVKDLTYPSPSRQG